MIEALLEEDQPRFSVLWRHYDFDLQDAGYLGSGYDGRHFGEDVLCTLDLHRRLN